MSRWTDLADWQGETPNEGGAMGRIRMLVVHIEQGTNTGSISWCKNASSKVSAHFFNPKAGRLVQLVDTDRVAWAEVDFNDIALSCENEGYSGESLTANQMENIAQLLARAHSVYGVPLSVLDDPSGGGVIGHGGLGAAGGGHYDCPGNPVLSQRAAIVARAAEILAIPTEDDMDMNTPVAFSSNLKAYFDSTGGAGFGDVMKSNFPAGGDAPFGVAESWGVMSARAAYLKAAEVDRKLDVLTALVQQLLAK